jgi:hypothetical protein
MAITFGQLVPIVMILVVSVVALTTGVDVVDSVRDTAGVKDCAARSDTFTSYNSTSNLCYNSSGSTTTPVGYTMNATSDGLTGISNLSGKVPTIATVLGAVLLIGILVNNFRK